jgi:Protein of unknown function (DUF1439)
MMSKLHALIYAIAAAVVLLIAACAALLGPRNVEIPLSRLQESIANRFPFNNRYLALLDVSVSNPRIALQPDSNRILTSMDTTIAPSFLDKSWTGNIAVSGQLRVDPVKNAVLLAEPRVEKFTVNGADVPYANQIAKIGSLLAEELLRDMPLYTFSPEDFRYAGRNFLPTRITTKTNGLVVTFEPAK